MARHLHHTQFDITRKLQEFGFGPSDSESDEDVEYGDSLGQSSVVKKEAVTSDWESIGLLPSWQKLQLTFRNASYGFLTSEKPQAVGPVKEILPSLITDTAVIDNEKIDSKESDKIGNRNNETDVLEIFDDEFKYNETSAHTQEQEREGESGLHGSDANYSDNNESDNNESDNNESDNNESNNNESEWEEIGRLPTFEQLQFTLRNASGIMGIPSIFQSEFGTVPKILNASDLLAKWGGPVSRSGLGWHSLVENFQLPSFFEEHSSSDEEDEQLDEAELAELCSEEGLTAEDRAVGYNEDGNTGCGHYLRNCKSECSQCRKFYMCQICHDEAQLDEHDDCCLHTKPCSHLHEPHEMNRQKTRRMLCLYCQRPQPVRRKCRFCKGVMGDYYCSICKLWNDDPNKSIYHCDKCGICRVGRGLGIDVFHCDTCGICLSLSVENNHKCIEQAAKSNCPICLDDLFASPRPTIFMLCGHPIHRECFNEYSKRYYRCPICAKSILNTSALFRMIDEEIQYEVLPPELKDKQVYIICQDCRLKSRTNYHLAGLKCETCGSYNTTQI